MLAALDGDLEAMIARLGRWADGDRPTEEFFRVGERVSRSVADQLDHAFLDQTPEDR